METSLYTFVFLEHRFRSAQVFRVPRRFPGVRLPEEPESSRGPCGARTSKLSEVPVVSKVLRSLKRARSAVSEVLLVQGPRKCPRARRGEDLERVQDCEANHRQILRPAGCSTEKEPARLRAKQEHRDFRAAVRFNKSYAFLASSEIHTQAKKTCPPCVIDKGPSHKPFRFCLAENYAPLRQVNKSCPVLHLPGSKLGVRGYMALQCLITRAFPRRAVPHSEGKELPRAASSVRETTDMWSWVNRQGMTVRE